jgi:1,2-phenylacetyl-CoA epoxidase PaaB subunit
MRWRVLARRTPTDALAEVGQLHAPDARLALLLARDCFFRHGEGVDYAVTDGEAMHACPDAAVLEFATDKSYKLQSGYTGLGAKRREVTERIAQEAADV